MAKAFHFVTVYAVIMTIYVMYNEYQKYSKQYRVAPLIPIIASAVAPVVIGGAAKTTEAVTSRFDGSRRL